MINRIAFVFGLLFSFWLAVATKQYVATYMPISDFIKIDLPLPKEQVKFAEVPNNYTSDDLNCLRDNIFFEARNQSTLGMAMVGIVTIQRTKYHMFPNTICGVVYEPHQFSWTDHKHKINLKNKIEAQALTQSNEIAEGILKANDLDKFYKDLVYYHSTHIKKPFWTKRMNAAFVIDDHIFYKAINEPPSFVLR